MVFLPAEDEDFEFFVLHFHMFKRVFKQKKRLSKIDSPFLKLFLFGKILIVRSKAEQSHLNGHMRLTGLYARLNVPLKLIVYSF